MKKTTALLLSLLLLSLSLAGCLAKATTALADPEQSPIAETAPPISPTPEATPTPSPTPASVSITAPDSPFDLTAGIHKNAEEPYASVDTSKPPELLFEAQADMDGDGIPGRFTVWGMPVIDTPPDGVPIERGLYLVRAVLEEDGTLYCYEERDGADGVWTPIFWYSGDPYVTDLNADTRQEISTSFYSWQSDGMSNIPAYWFRLENGTLTLEGIPALASEHEVGLAAVLDAPEPFVLRATVAEPLLVQTFAIPEALAGETDEQGNHLFFNADGTLSKAFLAGEWSSWWQFEELSPGIFGFHKTFTYEVPESTLWTLKGHCRYTTDGESVIFYDQEIVFLERDADPCDTGC